MNRARPTTLSLLLALGAGSVIACGSSASSDDGNDEPAPDANEAPAIDAAPAIVTIPTWQLEDIQPDSPRFGQTYGLDTFANQVIVVVLVEGF